MNNEKERQENRRIFVESHVMKRGPTLFISKIEICDGLIRSFKG